jgi:plasmid stability protein
MTPQGRLVMAEKIVKVTVRIPIESHERLKERARRHHRSVNSEITFILENIGNVAEVLVREEESMREAK